MERNGAEPIAESSIYGVSNTEAQGAKIRGSRVFEEARAEALAVAS